MTVKFILEFLVLIGALLMGARAGGVGLGLWGAVGLLVLVAAFGVGPGAIPGEVLLIVLTVIMAASAMEVAGGVDFLVRVAERIIRKNPKQVTIVAPLVTYGFTFASGTGHIVYPLLPVIYEVAHPPIAGHRAGVARRNVPGRERLLLHPQLRNVDCGDAIRPLRHGSGNTF
jgi:anaerobic C4-dicarboxylate transporter DcuA